MTQENINTFITQNGLKPADAVVVKKDFFGILDHYVIYLGNHNNSPLFIANYTSGIKLLPVNKLLSFLTKYSPIKINPFMGNDIERERAIERALSRLNEDNYNLILNNCEHYYNYVHFGIEISNQVKDYGLGLLLTGASSALLGESLENKKIRNAGLIVGGVGLGLLLFDAFNSKNSDN